MINLQADMPKLQYDNIDFLADKAKNNSGLSTLYYDLQSSELKKDTNTVKICINNNHISFCRVVGSAVKGDIFKHIGIYAFRKNILNEICKLKPSKNEQEKSLEQLRWLDNMFDIKVGITSYDSISVDTSDDIKKITAYFG